jgi:hypothetical protein
MHGITTVQNCDSTNRMRALRIVEKSYKGKLQAARSEIFDINSEQEERLWDRHEDYHSIFVFLVCIIKFLGFRYKSKNNSLRRGHVSAAVIWYRGLKRWICSLTFRNWRLSLKLSDIYNLQQCWLRGNRNLDKAIVNLLAHVFHKILYGSVLTNVKQIRFSTTLIHKKGLLFISPSMNFFIYPMKSYTDFAEIRYGRLSVILSPSVPLLTQVQ